MGHGSNAKLAFEHYAQLAKASEAECGENYIAPPEEVFRRHQPDTEARGKQEMVLREIHEDMMRIFNDPEISQIVATKKRKAMVVDLITGIVNNKIGRLHMAEEPTKLFESTTLAVGLRNPLSEGNITQQEISCR
jgi:hypothetical protein